MNRFFNYYNNLCNGVNTHNAFAYDPYIIAIKNMLVDELRRIIFYIEKLKDLKADMSIYSDKVIDFISTIIINLDFKKESFFIIIEDLYKNRKMLEEMYMRECDNQNLTYDLIDDSPEFTSIDAILKALNKQEKIIKEAGTNKDRKKQSLYEIIINLTLSACNSLIELKNLKVDFPQAKNMILKLINNASMKTAGEEELIRIIEEFSACNYQIIKLLNKTYNEKFGEPIKKKVLVTQKSGSAILVSGSSLLELEKILSAVKGLNISVYTHNDMINAFSYKKLNEHPNLTGHYRKEGNNLFADFASFPGPIYVSKNAVLKTDVIRGQIYTSAKYPAYGIGKIENNDYSELIKYALASSGFKKDEEECFFDIGYSNSDVENMIYNLIDKFKKKEINRIFIIGLINGFDKHNNYINSFFEEIPKSDFIISFAYNSDRENFFRADSYYDFVLLYNIIEIISQNEPQIIDKTSIFMPDCNSQIISHIFNLIHLKIKNIFLGPCCPNIIHPTLMGCISQLYSIKEISEPKSDIQKII